MNDPAVELKDVSLAFGGEPVLSSISIRIPKGALVAITGPSGCGKSTLLKISAGLVYPDSGTVTIEGVDIFNVSRSTLYELRKSFSFVFQDGALISNLTLYNNLALPIRYHYRLSDEEIEKRVRAVLDDFGLYNERGLMPAQLSSGQRKLASFARGIIMEPRLIFVDEPVSGIDAITTQRMVDKLLPLRDDNKVTMVMVSHNLDFIKSSADYIALIYQNKLFAYGTRDDILKSDDPILQGILSIIVDEQAVFAEEILEILSESPF